MCECAGADVFIIPVDAEIPVDALLEVLKYLWYF